MNVVVSGLMTSYQKSGNGKTIILLHGWGDSAAGFSQLVISLKDEYCIYALDLPGFGGSQRPPEAWGLTDYAKFVADWLKKLNIDQVCAVIGHSNGGAVAIQGFADGSLKADKLVLLASAGVRNQNNSKKQIFKLAAKGGKVITAPLPARTKSKLRKRFYSSIGSEALLAPELEETFRKTVNQDLQAAAKKINVPTLLVYGENDQSTPAKYGQLLASSIANADLQIIPGASHFLHQENTNVISNMIKSFLEHGK